MADNFPTVQRPNTVSHPLLATKLATPPARARLVARPHLHARLDAALDGKLTLIVAPPGSGKTTLLSSWLSERVSRTSPGAQRQPSASKLQPLQVAWVTLDESDNDPTRFWSYVISALDQLRPGSGDHALAMLRSPQPPPLEVVITAVLNALTVSDETRSERPGVVILDDYHTVTNPAVHESVAFMLDQMPPGLHLLIASREEPPLPLGRMRVRGQLIELRAADLRFSDAETAVFLNDVMGLNLTPDDVTTLESRTEGWIAALHLAAIALRALNERQAAAPGFTPSPAALRPSSSEWIAAFAGSHRYLVDYLAEEVLRRQPAPMQTFLLHTSILDQLCGELCDAVLEQGQTTTDERGSSFVRRPSSSVLEELERNNLFIVPLDNERRWYRYHQLFAEFLRERLRQSDPALLAELHRRAAAWFERQTTAEGYPYLAEAVSHALAGNDAERAARLVEQAARPMLLRSETATVLGWLEALPAETVQNRPELCVIWAWALAVSGRFDEVEPHLHNAEQAMALDPGEDDDGPSLLYAPYSRRNFRSEVLAVRATAAGLQRDIPRTISLARQALDLLPPDSVYVRAVVALMLGSSAYLSGDMAAAAQAFREAITASRAGDSLIIQLFALRQLGELQMKQGRLRQAARTFQQALDEAAARYPWHAGRLDRPIPVAGTAYVGMGLVCYEWNDLEAAAQQLAAGIALGQQGQNVEILLMGPIGLARARQAQGDTEAAAGIMHEAVQFARRTGVPRLAEWIHAEQARLWLLQGRVAEAAAWADAPDEQGHCYSAADEPSYLREIDYLTLAQLRLAQGRPGDVLLLLARLLRLAEAQGRQGSTIEILATQALAMHAAGHGSEALAALERALTLAQPEGYIRTFVDQGPPMQALLAQCRAQLERRPRAKARGQEDTLLVYLDTLLAAFPGSTAPLQSATSAASAPHAAPPLAEPLSEREIEVLQLIARGLANQEIADTLVVGLSTVKKHINNAYAKLEVKSRTQALLRARQLGLIE